MGLSRPHILFIALGIGLCAAASAQPQQQPTQPAPRSATVTLAANQGWTDTGLNVAEGDRLVLDMQPADRQSDASIAAVGPPTFSARIGEQVFAVEPHWEGTAPASGMLSLAAASRRNMPVNIVAVIEHQPRAVDPGPPPPDNGVEANGSADNAAEAESLLAEENGAAANEAAIADNGAEGNEAAGGNAACPPRCAPPPSRDWSWIIPWLLGAGGIVLLLTVAAEAKRRLGRGRAGDSAPPPATPPLIRPSLDRGEGGVAGDEIEAAGPDVRLGATLEPGGTFFDGNEPEVRDG